VSISQTAMTMGDDHNRVLSWWNVIILIYYLSVKIATLPSAGYFKRSVSCYWDERDVVTKITTRGAEHFLRSRQLFSHSRTSQHFMKPEGSLPCSQEPSTGLYPERHQYNAHRPILSKIHLNIFHPPTSWFSQWSLSFWLSQKYPTCILFSPIRAT
jgi:hypothetical protein